MHSSVSYVVRAYSCRHSGPCPLLRYVVSAQVLHACVCSCRGADVERSVLRPMGLRHRPRSLPDLPTPPRRVPGLLQRAARLLGREPLRRCRCRTEGHGATQFRQGRHPGSRHGRSGDAAGDLHQRGPAAAHDPPGHRVAERSRRRRCGPSRTRSARSAWHASIRSSAETASTSSWTWAPNSHAHHRHARGNPRQRTARGAGARERGAAQ